MGTEVSFGNAISDGAHFGGWLVGDLRGWIAARGAEFQELHPVSGLRNTDGIEVKWGTHEAQSERPGGWAAPATRVSLAVLVSGEFWFWFRRSATDEVTEVKLSRPGDYVLWSPTQEHTWRAVTDVIVITIRWPGVITPANSATQ